MKYYITHSFSMIRDFLGFTYRSDLCFERGCGFAAVYTNLDNNGKIVKIRARPYSGSIQRSVTFSVLEMHDCSGHRRPHNIKVELRA